MNTNKYMIPKEVALFINPQDDLGGLEIQKIDGTWISARPIPGTIVVNIGDLMHFWSGGRYRATPHRVRVTAEAAARSARNSIAVFVHPNNETDIRYKENRWTIL